MPQHIGSPKIRAAYAFLAQAEADGHVFTSQDLSTASGWSATTTKAYLSKKLRNFLAPTDSGYKCKGFRELTEESFCRLCSQSSSLSSNPLQPLHPPKVTLLAIKARETALAAVQHYNNPTAYFRSGNYIILMTIAFTSLFHAVFEREQVDYIEYDSVGTPIIHDGITAKWGVVKCARYYANNQITPMVRNIEFLIPLRNQLEHQSLLEIDAKLMGYCQSMLINFETILTNEFTRYYSCNTSLAFPMILSSPINPETRSALRHFQGNEYEALERYITDFNRLTDPAILVDQDFEFRVFLIPQTTNNPRTADYAISWIDAKKVDPEQLNELNKRIIAVKRSFQPQLGDPTKDYPLPEKTILIRLREQLGDVQFGEEVKTITGPMVRWVVTTCSTPNLSGLYYRAAAKNFPTMYSEKFIGWVVDEYNKDHNFFYNAKVKAYELQAMPAR